jgi:hypothetical protein
MNATNTAQLTTPSNNSFARMAKAFWAQVRYAFELSGAPYVNGPMPPL